MKYLNLIIFILFANSFFSQTNVISSTGSFIENISILQDTTSSTNNYKLNFKLNVQNIDSIDSIDLTILDQNSSEINNIGSYVVKFHQVGFYYLENSSLEKITFLNNVAFFIKIINSSIYNTCWKIQLKTKSKLNIVTTTSYLIPK